MAKCLLFSTSPSFFYNNMKPPKNKNLLKHPDDPDYDEDYNYDEEYWNWLDEQEAKDDKERCR